VVEVRSGLSASLVALVVLLALLEGYVGLAIVGWATGIACGVLLAAGTARTAANGHVELFGPADLVTLTRATLSCGVAALVADSFGRSPLLGTPADIMVPIAALALSLDAVDGQVARMTGTVSRFGARLDGEADAFLMLVLSLYVAGSVVARSADVAGLAVGVLAIGTMRYVFAVAGWVLPWMRAQLPSRYWRKVVTAIAGIALLLATADIGSRVASYTALALALALLLESFGRDVWWLWWHRPDARRDRSREATPARLSLR